MKWCVAVACSVVLLGAGSASAQSWSGPYAGGFVGGGFLTRDTTEIVRFDTNLDGAFTDVVRTIAGVDAFSPGFCGGSAVNAVAATGCVRDRKSEVEFGGRGGYDWQSGHLVFGGLVDVSRTGVADSVTAFSTTPAFYTFTRELDVSIGLRGRIGVGSSRLLAYGTGGAAWAMVDQAFTTSNRVNTFVAVNQKSDGDRERVWGYQAGGGVELRLAERVSLIGEYVFTSLDNRESSTIRSQGPAPATNAFVLANAAGTELQRTRRFEVQSARVSVNYRF